MAKKVEFELETISAARGDAGSDKEAEEINRAINSWIAQFQ